MIPADQLEEIAAAHGTPTFVYDLDAVAERARRLRGKLPERVDLAYAVKANPSLAVLATLAGSGMGADVASAGELMAAQRAGFDPDRIVFTGPGKRDDELSVASSLPLRAITIESVGELDRLRRAASPGGGPVRVMLRAAGEDRSGNVIGSGQGRFGMRWPDLVAAAGRAAAAPELELVGLHRFDASNLLEAEALLDRARATIGLAADLAAEVGHRLAIVDVGGGLGIPYVEGGAELDLELLGRGLHDMLDEVDAHPRLAGARLLLEPGRWLAGPAGVYLTRVVDVKEAETGRIVTVDGGIHHLLRPALVGEPHRIESVTGLPARHRQHVLVGGPLCTGLDVLGHVDLPAPQVGDLLAVRDVGAYGFTESMPYFLSHPQPAEIAVRQKLAFVARHRVEPADILAMQEIGAALTREAVGT